MSGVGVTDTPQNCRDAWLRMHDACREGPVRNYVQVLDMSDFVVTTDLFPLAALEAYTSHNLERPVNGDQGQYMNQQRGGAQGDYRQGMRRKIDNLVDCLARFPLSKRAVLTVSNDPAPQHDDDAAAKCVRELQLYADEADKLSGTVFLRAQAVTLFPKNLHMLGSIMTEVAERLPWRPSLGSLFYLTGVLVPDRE